MRVMWKAWPVAADKDSAARMIWPPPSPWAPSRWITDGASAIAVLRRADRPLLLPAGPKRNEVPGRRPEHAAVLFLEVAQECFLGLRIRLRREEPLHRDRDAVRAGTLQAQANDRLQLLGREARVPRPRFLGHPDRNLFDPDLPAVAGLHEIAPELELGQGDVTKSLYRVQWAGTVETAAHQRDLGGRNHGCQLGSNRRADSAWRQLAR